MSNKYKKILKSKLKKPINYLKQTSKMLKYIILTEREQFRMNNTFLNEESR